MADTTFNTPAGQTIDRENLIVYLNTGTASSPTWSAIGKRVEDSSLEMDWDDETTRDILGGVYTTLKKPTITQSFDPVKLDSADSAYVSVWNKAIKEQDINALSNLDLLLVHFYAGNTDAPFAERYPSSTIKVTSIGGEGGGVISMPFDVTFGGVRDTGTASRNASGVVTFTSAAA